MKRKLTEQIAVVSMGCLLPDAQNPNEFWQNILNKKVSIEPAHAERFDKDAHFRPEMFGKTEKFDKTYTELGSTAPVIDFDGRRFRLPPTVVKHMDSNQKAMVLSTEQALSHITHDTWDKNKVSVFIGSTFIGELHHHFQRRVHFDRFSFHLKKHADFVSLDKAKQNAVLNDLEQRFLAGTFMVSEDTAPGVLPNIIAARINSVFDFHGHAYMIDAACASTLAAIINGVQHLESGESDVVICGGADFLNAELGRIYFSGINALSPDGSFPFDERANGFVIGEGGGVVILKRFSDAIRDKDNILALISGYGQNSDGKGKAIAAPNHKWQAKAIEDAITMSGVDPNTIELIEAHGTSTKVGDKSEIDALNLSFKNLGVNRQNFCAVGSAKSNVGHLKAAAGVPGFIKAVMALNHKMLPPTANCVNINQSLNLTDSPFYINTEAKEWQQTAHPRRAGVSAFGFGGANYHIVLEEHREADVSQKLADIKKRKAAHHVVSPAPLPALKEDDRTNVHRETRNGELPKATVANGNCLALFVSADSLSQLRLEVERILTDLSSTETDVRDLLHLVLAENCKANANDQCRLGVSFKDRIELKAKMATVQQVLAQSEASELSAKWRLLAQKGIFYKDTPPIKKSEIAFLFPGQASQYPDMCLDLLTAYPQCAAWAAPMDLYWKQNCGSRISDLIFSGKRGKEETAALLKNTRNTHPALLFGSVLCHEILSQHGVAAGYMVGHSAGEISALYAGGCLDLENALMLMDYRSRSFVEMTANRPDGSVDFGKMAAVKTTFEQLETLIRESETSVALANLNSPRQLIVSGFSEEMDTFLEYLDKNKVGYVVLNVSHAFHSPVVKPAADAYQRHLKDISFKHGHTAVMANETNKRYSQDANDIRHTLHQQITGPVRFMGSIQKLASEGIRVFVETGPNQVLSSLTRAILEDDNVSIISCNPKNKPGLEGMQSCLAALFAEGVPVRYLPPQFVGKDIGTDNHPPVAPLNRTASKIVYSGVAVGLPGSYKDSFRDDNFDQLFEGRNFIEALSESERAALADLNVSKVEKTAQGPVFHLLDALEDVIQLAGKIGKIDALRDYHLDADEVAQMNQAILQAVAAGFEALRDARIPLVHQYNKTASGGLLPDKWVIPKEMQRRTGIIFAHGFPMVETVAAEVTRHLNHRFSSVSREKQIDFYQELLPLIQDAKAKNLLTNWFIDNQSQLRNAQSEDDVFKFNHQFINQISSLANVRLAQYIQALGPNFQLNAACSSTCTAITLSEEMIASGRVDRMLILGADDATSKQSLPYLGAGFLSTGAATCKADIYEAALPFDQRRNGMIMSAGAVALVVERLDEAQKRGVRPVCELLGSHIFNTAGHHARLNVPMYAEELKFFMDDMAAQHSLKMTPLSEDLLYVSHETYTPARGGCSEAEAVSLRHVFGNAMNNIVVTNTKGMTGHTMGASIEDVLAARALESGRVPPVVNFKVPDPKLAGLNLSKGGSHSRHYALRMAAGFGSQGNYLLLGKYGDESFDASAQNPLTPENDKRIEYPERYVRWLSEISETTDVRLELAGRILRVVDSRQMVAGTPPVAKKRFASKDSTSDTSGAAALRLPQGITNSPEPKGARNRTDIQQLVFNTVSEVSGYAPEMLEADMEVENDLGIDTVKQATILGMLGEKIGVADEFEFQIAAYPTLAAWIDLFTGMTDSSALLGSQKSDAVTTDAAAMSQPQVVSNGAVQKGASNRADIRQLVFDTVSEVSGYAPEMLEADMEVENDLGIDTVKQATILGMLGEKLGVADEFEFQIAAYPTLASWIDLFAGMTDDTKNDPGAKPNVPPIETSSHSPLPQPITQLTHHCLVKENIAVGAAISDTALKSHRLILITTSAVQTDLFMRICKDRFADVAVVNLENESAASSIDAFRATSGESGLPELWLDVTVQSETETVNTVLDSHFDFCKAALKRQPRRIVSLGAKNATHGALIGFYQSLSKEWEIDYVGVMASPTAEAVSATTIHAIFTSLSQKRPCAVIDLEKDVPTCWRVREVASLVSSLKDSSEPQASIIGDTSDVAILDWQPTDVLLVVGATGITPKVALAFAANRPSRVAIVDRVALSKENYLTSEWEDANHAQRKKEIHSQLQKSQVKVRPVDVEKAFQSKLKQREMQKNIALLRDAGADVRYFECDITDAKSVKNAMSSIQTHWGDVNGILHGAGIEESALLSKKEKADFLRVINPKIVGTQNLIHYGASKHLKLWTCFSSISGVFGNAAQVDYSAANSFLNFYTLELQEKFPGILARSIAWSGWAQTGMAWRNTYVRENADKIGLHLIAPEDGAEAAVALMTGGQGPAIQIVHRGLGHMLDGRWQSKSAFPKPTIDSVEKQPHGYRFFKTLDVANDEWLNQHRLIDVPLLPAVGYLEMMAEIHCWKNDFAHGICIENLVVHDAFKLTQNRPRELYLDATVSDEQGSNSPVAIKIYSEIQGRLFSDTRLYCSGSVSGAESPAPEWADIWTEPEWTQKGDHFEVFEGLEKLPQNVVFGNLYHDFKRPGANIEGMTYKWTDTHLMRDYGFPMEAVTNPKYPLEHLEINFCLMDSLHQAGVVHTVLQTGKVHLPCGANQFVIYDKCDAPMRYKNYVRMVEQTTDRFVYDIFLLDENNRVCATVYGCEFRKIS